jgi:hypothetical protein
MQTMPQDKNSQREGYPDEDFAEASLIYVIHAFQEKIEEDPSKVWKALDSPTKAHLRRMMALEQLMAGEAV